LMEKCNLHTIVRLPLGVFNPYTNINTNILFFEKGTPTKEIWYYQHKHPVGVKNYNKTKPINIKEFDVEKEWWNNRVENDVAWKVSLDDIKARDYNLDIKNPKDQEQKELEASKVILDRLHSNNKVVDGLLMKIKEILN